MSQLLHFDVFVSDHSVHFAGVSRLQTDGWSVLAKVLKVRIRFLTSDYFGKDQKSD